MKGLLVVVVVVVIVVLGCQGMADAQCLKQQPLIPASPLMPRGAMGHSVLCSITSKEALLFVGAPSQLTGRNGKVYGWSIGADGVAVALELEDPRPDTVPVPNSMGSAIAYLYPWLAVGADSTTIEQGSSKVPSGAVHFWKKQEAQGQFLFQNAVTMSVPLFSNARFGSAIQFISAEWMAVGAPDCTPAASPHPSSHGCVVFLNQRSSMWVPSTTLYGSAPGVQLGSALRSLNSGGVVIGASGAAPSGAVQIALLVDLNSWEVVQTIQAPPGTPHASGFGHRIDVSDRWMVVGAKPTDPSQTTKYSIWLYKRDNVDSFDFAFVQQIDSPADGFGKFGLAFASPHFLGVSLINAFHVFTLNTSKVSSGTSLWEPLYEWSVQTGRNEGGTVSGCSDGVFLIGTPAIADQDGYVALYRDGPCDPTTAPAIDVYIKVALIATGIVVFIILLVIGVILFLRWRRNRAARYNATVLDSWEDDTKQNTRWSETL